MKKKPSKQYSQAEKTTALIKLAQNDGNRYQTAKQINIPGAILSRWVKEAEAQPAIGSSAALPSPDDDTDLDDQLERLARQMVAVMPGKVEEANLQELARTLAIVLNTMNQARAGKEQTSHAREKLAEILERYAVGGSAEGTAETADG